MREILATVLILVSIVLQAVAVAYSLYLSNVTRRGMAWRLIAAALGLMVLRRVLSLYWLVSGNPTYHPDLITEMFSLPISLLVALGISRVAPVFHMLRESESEQRDAQQLFHSTLDALTAHIAILDDSGRIVEVNPAWRRFADANSLALAGHAVGANYLEMCDHTTGDGAEDAAAMAAGMRDVLAGGCEEFTLEYACHGVGGQQWFVARVTRTSGAGPTRLVVAHENVTPLKQASQALRQSEESYRRLIETAEEGIWIVDSSGVTTYVNAQMAAMLGYLPAEMVGRPLVAFLDDEGQRIAAAQVEKRWRDWNTPRDLCFISKQEGHVWGIVSANSIVDGHGAFAGGLAMVTDITERKRVERALAQSQARLHEILENSLDLAYRLNLTTGTYEYFSPSIVRLTGLPIRDGAVVTLDDVLTRVHPDDVARCGAAMARRWDVPQSLDGAGVIEYRFLHADGEYRWFEDHSNPIGDDSGRIVALVGTVRDVTDRKRAGEAILAAARMEATATLAGGIAHEYNNLMVGVLGNAEMLRSDFENEGDEELSEMLTDISQSARRAGDLARQLLAFARGGKYEHKVFNLADTVLQTLTLRESLAPERMKVITDIVEAPCRILGDSGQLSQVVVSLFTNAVEAISENGEIVIRLGIVDLDSSQDPPAPELKPGPHARLSVSDNGSGMTPEVLRRVFEPFFTTRFQGRGLGLAAVYGIVRNHNGAVIVKSVEGQGSEFEVFLPIASA